MGEITLTIRDKTRANKLVAKALRQRVLKPPLKCEGCGKKKRVIAHHPDYTSPLSLMWLCHKCHYAWHRLNGFAKTVDKSPYVTIRVTPGLLKRIKVRAAQEGLSMVTLIDKLSR